MAAAATIFWFLKLQNFIAIWVARVETHQHAKFRQNRSIGCEDIKIFLIFQDGNIIWLPWQRPLQIGKYGIDLSSAHKAHSYGEKIAKISLVNPEIFDEICWNTTWTRNTIFIKMFSAETTGLIFTKILHDIVALVASRSKTKLCFHLANVQRMHVVSVYLHFGNIIWLPWQRPLTNWKIKCSFIIGT